MTAATSPKILHLDHTSTSGGAEYALLRMLSASPAWRPLLLLPPTGDGVYAPLRGVAPIRHAGVAQPAGVSAGRLGRVAAASAGLALQAIATRTHPAFRTADLVDANTARSAAYGALAAYSSRVPFVVHLRDVVDVAALGSVGFATMTRIVLPRADGVIANSRATLESAEPYLRRDAATAVIPSASGLHPVAGRPARGDGPLRIGMLARIDPWKGQDALLEAFAAAFPDGDERLQLAGAPLFGHEDFFGRLRVRARELGVGERVDFLGHVDDVPGVISTWDVGVQYSQRAEPLGQNVLQYLAAGVAPIVADEGGPTEWVVDGVNGLRVAPRDPAALSHALRRLIDDDELRDRLGAAASATDGLLTDAQVAEAHAAFYATVLTGADRA